MRSGNLGWSDRTYSQRPLGLLSIPESGPSSDGDDLRARIRQFLLVPVAELFLDSEARTGKEAGQCVYAKEPQGTSTGLRPGPASTCERYGERDSVPGNGCLDMVRHSYLDTRVLPNTRLARQVDPALCLSSGDDQRRKGRWNITCRQHWYLIPELLLVVGRRRNRCDMIDTGYGAGYRAR